MRAKVSEKGQVTIPKRLRDRLGIRTGEVLEFEEQEGRLVAAKAGGTDRVEAVYGIVDLPRPVDRLIDEMRGD